VRGAEPGSDDQCGDVGGDDHAAEDQDVGVVDGAAHLGSEFGLDDVGGSCRGAADRVAFLGDHRQRSEDLKTLLGFKGAEGA